MKILVGIDGTERGERALEWAARYGAREGAALTLIAVVDPAAARAYGIDKQTGDAAIEGVLQEAKDKVLAKYPDTEVDTVISVGKVVDCLVDAAESHDMVVMGSHHGLPAILTKPAEAMGGGLDPVGEQYQRNLEQLAAELKADNEELDVVAHAVEGSSPTHAILNYAKDSKLLVLGTHSRSTLGRTLFGSVTHSVLLNLCVPTVIVPQK